MDIFTVSNSFLAQRVIEEYQSAIWTERYTAPGDVQLVVPASIEMIELLKEGTFLGLNGSEEIMIIETAEIQKGLLTVTGRTFLSYLNQRMMWRLNPTYGSGTYGSGADIRNWSARAKPGQFIADVVDFMVINNSHNYPGAMDLEWDLDKIPGLTLGAVDTSGDLVLVEAVTGPLLDAIQPIADQHGVGMRLYLESADPIEGFSLKFSTYRGLDRTSGQSANSLVRLLPDMDSLTDVKEIHSIANYKNVAYVWWQNTITQHFANPELPEPEGLDRRVIVVTPQGNPTNLDGSPGDSYYTPAEITAFREKEARDALANYNYIRAVDGQTSPNNDYQFGTDYFLGDVIELQGITGQLSKARITEYIRTQDKIGERAYPTISVIT